MTQDEISELDATLGESERLAETLDWPEQPVGENPPDAAMPGCLEWKLQKPRGNPTVGVCVTARNEGRWLSDTVRSLLSAGVDQIVVVDDGSEDGCCGRKGLPAMADLVRNNASIGVSRSRQAGFDCLWTDVLATCDGHVGAPEGGAFRDAALMSLEREAMVCASSKPMAHNGWVARGGSLKLDKRQGAFLVPLDSSARGGERFKRFSGLFGSVYIAPKSVWRRVNGFVPNGVYGYNEQTLAMQCWFAGVPILWDGLLVCAHMLKPKAVGYPKDCIFRNVMDAHYALFGGRWFEEWWKPGIVKRHPRLAGWKPAAELSEWREAFLAKRAKTDEEFFLELASAPVPHGEFYPSRKRDSGGKRL